MAYPTLLSTYPQWPLYLKRGHTFVHKGRRVTVLTVPRRERGAVLVHVRQVRSGRLSRWLRRDRYWLLLPRFEQVRVVVR